MTELLLPFFAAMLASGINAVAGGGTFFLFPILVFMGLPPVVANATCTVGVWPGSLGSVWAYRSELGVHARRMPALFAISLVGGGIGAWLLLALPSEVFEALVPWLLLSATLLFMLSGRIRSWLVKPQAVPTLLGAAMGLLGQFVIAVYGGYFGAGIGILMLALLGILGIHHIHEANALKTLLGSAMNGVAVVLFIAAGAVDWGVAPAVILGGLVGGYLAARYARRLPATPVRYGIIAYGLLMTVWFFAAA